MPLGLLLGLGRSWRRKRTSSLDILSSKRGPRDYYKGKNCKPTGFHTRKDELMLFLAIMQLKPYVSQCPINVKSAEAADSAK
ncbi:hypothetical protein RHMOL_Rhmol05G0117800 [Rhododendron molle]|nr:hypothetical protein RHMOL_Rhmol05G0117800 [Rhododendron molle]KAI8554686.1 hypothetical protein RHMOL_Rhmol05G0117800 [Rhododendron molle]KAI8554688.1 hypothetical protein RHMOL_Rhmol05G0117800 [Rhododendron molle]